MFIKPSHHFLQYGGRIDWNDLEAPDFIFPSTYVRAGFIGNKLKIYLENKNSYWDNYIGYIIDGNQFKAKLNNSGRTVIDIELEGPEQKHDLMVFKRQDACHEVVFVGLELDEDGVMLELPPKSSRRIEVYGDSVSAGEVSEAVDYTGQCDPEHNGEFSNSWYSYAWMVARALGAELHNISQGGAALLDGTGWFNAPDYIGMESIWDKTHYNPCFGDATPWNFEQYRPQVVIVAIGQNDSNPRDYMKENEDGPEAIAWRNGYKELLNNIRKKYDDAYIVCCTTLLQHDAAWDRAIYKVISECSDSRISQCVYKRNGVGTPGHLRIDEAKEMANELILHIDSLDIKGW